MIDLPFDWEALAIMDDAIASSEIQVFLLRRTSYRPEAMRVVMRDKWFLVQSKRPGRDRWITQKEWLCKEDAILDCINWYPNPNARLEVKSKE
jgi:hypothetical protein